MANINWPFICRIQSTNMSLYDTENLMQQSANLLGDNNLLLDADLFEEEIAEACQFMKEYYRNHWFYAAKYAKLRGNTNASKLDMILGIDDIVEIQTEDGDTFFAAIDWTDDPINVSEKKEKMASRKEIFDILGIDVCIAVCITQHVRIDRKVERARFASNVLFDITLKAEEMIANGKYASTLELFMKTMI